MNHMRISSLVKWLPTINVPSSSNNELMASGPFSKFSAVSSVLVTHSLFGGGALGYNRMLLNEASST